MNIFLTGATGFVGGFLLRELKNQGYSLRALVRDRTRIDRLGLNVSEIVVGDVTKPDSLQNTLAGCDAIIHLVAIIDERKRKNMTFERVNYQATLNMIVAAQAQGIHRFIHMSALGADPQGVTAYFRTKGRAEEAVRQSGLDYTIFRPSFIYGPGDAVYTMLAKMIRLVPFGLVPIFGNGLYRHQPVLVSDLVRGMVSCLDNPEAVGKTFDVGGPQALTYREQLTLIGEAVGKSVRPLSLPIWFSRALAGVIGGLPFSPINRDKLAMLINDNVCDPSAFATLLSSPLVPFFQGVAESVS